MIIEDVRLPVVFRGPSKFETKLKDSKRQSFVLRSYEYNPKTNKKESTSTFIDATFSTTTSDMLEKFTKVGEPVLLRGDLEIRTYTSKDGEVKITGEIAYAKFSFIPKSKEEEGGSSRSEEISKPAGRAPAPTDEVVKDEELDVF